MASITLTLLIANLLILGCAGVPRISDLLPGRLGAFEWLIGKWETEYIPGDGLVFWPTIPTMNYEETLEFWPAEVSSQAGGVLYINYSAVATSLNSGDHFHNEYGYLTITPRGYVKLFAIGNNGFGTSESGHISQSYLRLESDHVDKIIVARELEVEAIVRTFSVEGPFMHQRVFMRTITHPEHRRNECDNRHDEPRCMQAHTHQTYRKVLSLAQRLEQMEEAEKAPKPSSSSPQKSQVTKTVKSAPAPSPARSFSSSSSSNTRSSQARSFSSSTSRQSSVSASGTVNGPAFRNKWKGWQNNQG